MAVIFAVLDSARSVGASQFTTKSLSDMAGDNFPDLLDGLRNYVMQHAGATVWNMIDLIALQQPGWLVFGVLALLFYCLGYRRTRRLGRFTA